MVDGSNPGIPYRRQAAYGSTPALHNSDFGVDSLASRAAGGPSSTNKILADHERGAAPPIGGNQANPDHGDK